MKKLFLLFIFIMTVSYSQNKKQIVAIYKIIEQDNSVEVAKSIKDENVKQRVLNRIQTLSKLEFLLQGDNNFGNFKLIKTLKLDNEDSSEFENTSYYYDHILSKTFLQIDFFSKIYLVEYKSNNYNWEISN